MAGTESGWGRDRRIIKIIVEIKAVESLHQKHSAQLMNYLKATGHRLGLLVNFGAYPKVDIRRIVV